MRGPFCELYEASERRRPAAEEARETRALRCQWLRVTL
jgi:hypothetical protein